jgi:flagellar hook-associated protein 2
MSTVSALGSSQVTAQLSQVESRQQAPITALDTQITGEKAEISAWGNISGAISTLSTALAGISDVSTINNRTVTSSTTTVATATAKSSAATGTYDLTNVTLAKTQEIYSSLLGSGAATLSGGAGSLSFTLKSGKTEKVTVGSGSLTLNGIAAAINKAAGGVQASVLGTTAGARLVLQSSATGSSQAFSVTGTGALAQFAYAPGSAGTTEIKSQTASNAAFSVNGVPVTSTSNTVSSAVTGLSISLVGSGASTINVSSSPTTLSGAVSSVATSLNAALSTIAKEIVYKPAVTGSASSTATAGPLLGNFTATNLSNQLLTAVSGAAASGLSANAIGLKVSSAGAVTFDSTKFASAYTKSPSAVQALVGKIYKALDSISTAAIGGSGSSTNITGTTTKSTGSIGAQTVALNGVITSINTQITEITKENKAALAILLAQYTAAENTSTAASVTQSYLDIFTNTSSTSSG